MEEPFGISALAETFRRFAGSLAGSSELYRVICEGIATSDDTLRLMEVTPAAQRYPMLLLAAVHDLLLAGAAHPLRDHYPTLGGQVPKRIEEVQGVFNDFCMQNASLLRPILAQRATQTNEIGRVAALRPVLATLADERIEEVALAEFGASAGLNLLLDACHVIYSDGSRAGDADAPVQIECELRGPLPPGAFLARTAPTVAFRLGLDQSPVSVDDEVATRWLLACVWPDQVQRFQRTKAAFEVARQRRPSVLHGRLPEDGKALLEKVPSGPHLCILTTWVLAYLSERERTELDAQVAQVAASRDVTWILAESPGYLGPSGAEAAEAHKLRDDATILMSRRYRNGARTDILHANMHGHGTWIRWL